MEVRNVKRVRKYAGIICFCFTFLLIFNCLHMDSPNVQDVFQVSHQKQAAINWMLQQPSVDAEELYVEEVDGTRNVSCIVNKITGNAQNREIHRIAADFFTPTILSVSIPYYYLEKDKQMTNAFTEYRYHLLTCIHKKDG